MSQEGFEVIVGVSSEMADSDEVAVAEATRYLATADTTNTFGHNARVFDVNVYDGGDGLDYGVGLHFSTILHTDDELKSFMDEMTTLAHVESVERIPMVEA